MPCRWGLAVVHTGRPGQRPKFCRSLRTSQEARPPRAPATPPPPPAPAARDWRPGGRQRRELLPQRSPNSLEKPGQGAAPERAGWRRRWEARRAATATPGSSPGAPLGYLPHWSEPQATPLKKLLELPLRNQLLHRGAPQTWKCGGGGDSGGNRAKSTLPPPRLLQAPAELTHQQRWRRRRSRPGYSWGGGAPWRSQSTRRRRRDATHLGPGEPVCSGRGRRSSVSSSASVLPGHFVFGTRHPLAILASQLFCLASPALPLTPLPDPSRLLLPVGRDPWSWSLFTLWPLLILLRDIKRIWNCDLPALMR